MRFFESTIICVLLAVFISSCDSYFEVGELDSEEQLVVYCLPVAGQDTTVIQLSKSVTLGGSGLPTFGLAGAEINFNVNGEAKEVLWNEEGSGILPPMCYYSVAKIKAGDVIEVEAAYKGLPKATSRTVVPQSFPVEKVELTCKPGENVGMQVRVTFTDPVGSDDYFGVKMVRQEVFQESVGDVVTDVAYRNIVTCDFAFDDEPIFNNKVGLDAALNFDYDYYDYLYIWTDTEIQGRTYTLRMDTSYLTPEEFSYTNWDGNVTTAKVYYRYKIYLYRLTKEFYSFLKSVNDIANNNLGLHGFAPLRGSYTNVSNGFGVVGGCQISESPWLDSPVDDNSTVWGT